MSDSIVFSDVEEFYQQSKKLGSDRHKNNSTLKTKILKILVAILICVLIVEAIVYTLIIPGTATVQIRFNGLKNLTSSQLVKDCNVRTDSTWIQFDTAATAARLANSPLIESVKVEKVFPDQVVITVAERVPVAASIATINGKSVPIQIDKNGVVFRVNEGSISGNIPLITGFTFDNLHAGLRLHDKLRPLLQQIGELMETKPAYFSLISEIKVVGKEYGGYDLIVFPMYSKVRVILDRKLNEESLQRMMVVLDVVNSLDPDVSVVDLRDGSLSFWDSMTYQGNLAQGDKVE